MATYNDEGVVLRTFKLGESDRVITLLTRQHGLVRAVAKGVRRTSSRFGARLEPFSQVDVQIVERRSLGIITQAVSRQLLGQPLLGDYPRYTAAAAMAETASRLVPEEGTPAVQQYRLLTGALRALSAGTADGQRPAPMILDSYLLRALATAGYAPVLDGCAACGRPGPQPFFSPQAGGLVCAGCRPPGAAAIGPASLAYLGALLAGRWEATRTVPAAVADQASGLVAAFANWQLERSLRSLAHVER
ncbi:MAG: DNA repair protein RecO [Propionibacteriaceae bacterium]|nr:DNA repair protein RecO [Propionibacteriaceae bacterium]